jgi:hypothetical protein
MPGGLLSFRKNSGRSQAKIDLIKHLQGLCSRKLLTAAIASSGFSSASVKTGDFCRDINY